MQLVPISPRINGHSYEWADIQFSIAGGIPIVGITEINYSYSRNITNIYGAGSEPISVGYGAKTYDASITLKLEEVQNLLAIAPFKDLSQIPSFSISVSWLDTENAIKTDVLKYVKFNDYNIKTKAGDTSTDISMKLTFAGLE